MSIEVNNESGIDVDESVLQRLHYLGYVQPDIATRDKPGRPANRWQVNPALAAT